MSKLTVTYIKHSGFLIETANSYLLFDYWQGKLPELQYDKELYIFSMPESRICFIFRY